MTQSRKDALQLQYDEKLAHAKIFQKGGRDGGWLVMMHLNVAALAIISALSASPASSGVCNQMGSLAESIMVLRQGGMPIAQTIEALVSEDMEKPIADLFMSIILQAYGQMGYSSEKARQRSIVEFANMVTVACYKGTALPAG
jgi:hypothetical protein